MPKSTGRKKKQREAVAAANRVRNGIQGGQNIAEIERVVSSILGGTMLIGGLAKRTLTGLAIAVTGVAFLHRGATGHCKVYESIGMDTSGMDTSRNTLDRDCINERLATAQL